MNKMILTFRPITILKSILLVLLFSQITFAGNTNVPNTNGIIDISTGWKFHTGDNLQWAESDFDDNDWENILSDRYWEDQNYKNYNGYAWYRITTFIPSSLIDNAFYKDSIQFVIGKVDDTEQTFLNGKLIGQNGEVIPADSKFLDNFTGDKTAYKIFRKYVLPVTDSRILWDQENTITIRVHDHMGNGGLNNSKPSISMVDLKDFFKILTNNYSFRFLGKDKIQKTIELKNESKNDKYKGKFYIKVIDIENNKIVFESKKNISIGVGQTKITDYTFTGAFSKSYKAYYKFTERKTKVSANLEQTIPYLLTPRASEKPQINGAKIFGVRPDAPFLYTIPVTGERPIDYKVENLPTGLKLDEVTGRITGSIKKIGEYNLIIKVENKKGKDKRDFKIVVGDNISLTPPLGWNSWNCWGLNVTGENIREAADFMESSGLINHGWTYINIDDGWEAGRDTEGRIESNDKFPDMKALSDYVHGKGLKIGIYSSPGTETCGGYIGSYQHEIQDAQTFSDWDIDYLKHDWCSYGRIAKDKSVFELQKPYLVMRDALDKVNRDIIYSLCQYGMGDVWEWGADVGGDLWRTTYDITDTWLSMSTIGFAQDINSDYSAPGHWNDPDMLVVGQVGWNDELRQTKLTVDEQYTHISLWALLSAPLLLGCDLTQIDDFTLNLLTNDEILDVNQDMLGKQAKPILKTKNIQIWVKDLEDGTKAVGLFNLGDQSQKIAVEWTDLNMANKLNVRDLWRQKDMGVFSNGFEQVIPSHGVMLIKVSE